MEPKVSVIIPVYNAEKYLYECMDSVIGQSLKDIEIICVNDGSKDDSLKILESYKEKDTRIKVISIPNGGVSKARNVAIKVASGKYLAFCDSDDTVPVNAYKCLFKVAEKKRAQVVVGGFCDISELNIQQREVSLMPANKSRFNDYFLVPCLWNKLIRRDFVERNAALFEMVPVGEDVTFLAYLYPKIERFSAVKKIVYNHWTRLSDTQSLNHQYSFDLFQEHVHCRNRLLSYCDYSDEAKEYVYLKLSLFLVEYFCFTFNSNEKEKIFKSLQNHLAEYDWTYHEDFFHALVGIDSDTFWKLDAQKYWENANLINHREMLLKEFGTGQIGAKYIILYSKAWIAHKIKSIFKN